MTAWRFVALLTVYVSLDLACPAVPGAFTFAPEESTEVVHLPRWVPAPPAVLPSVARPRPPAPKLVRPVLPRRDARRRPPATRPPAALMAPVEAESAADD